MTTSNPSSPVPPATSRKAIQEPRTHAKRWLRFSLSFLLWCMFAACILFFRYGEDLRAYFNEQDRIVPTSFDLPTGKNVLWKANIGSQTYSTPTVSGGKVFIGTNNGAGYLDRYPADYDLGVLLCFDAENGEFQWQASSEKLPDDSAQDLPFHGVESTPLVEGNRLWYVTNRAEVVCLDTEGYLDQEDDGIPHPEASSRNRNEADIVWRFDMVSELGVTPHHWSSSSVCSGGDTIFAVTGQGVHQGAHDSRESFPNAEPPSFVAIDKWTGELLWTDSSPGDRILHGQWGSPTFATIQGQPQVIFPGGDGWLYSFDPEGDGNGHGKLLWKFDCNPKDSKWILGGRGMRNHPMTAPTVANDQVFVTVGQSPEHGEGNGHVWCIDPTKRGDVSPTLVQATADDRTSSAKRRWQAFDPERGDTLKVNPNSGVIWHFDWTDLNGNQQRDFEEEMHRSLSRVAIKNGFAFVTDFSGIVHCLDASTGIQRWSYDMFAACWSTPAIGFDHIFVGDEDGDVAVFRLDGNPGNRLGTPLVSESNAGSSVYPTPVIHQNVLYIATRSELIAIANPDSVGE